MKVGSQLGVGHLAILSAPTWKMFSVKSILIINVIRSVTSSLHLLADVLSILDVQLVQSLDVVVDEGDGDQHQVLLSCDWSGCGHVTRH